jgi:hypothetical protein
MPFDKTKDIHLHFDLHPHLEGLEYEKLTALDLGCGAYNSVVAAQVLDYPWKKLTGLDGYQPDLDSAAEKPCVAKELVLKKGDVRKFTGKYDVILSFDVLEHMVKEEGIKWLERIEKAAKKRIVLFFPVEPEDFHRDNDWPENPLQDHLSHWKGHELKSRGYEIAEFFGCHSAKKEDGSTVTFGAIWAIKNIE